MPLPEQIMNRINREQAATPGWSSQLLMFSGTVFFISLAVYFGMVFGYQPYLQGQVAVLDNQIASYSKQIAPEEQNKLISFYSQIANLQGVLKNHIVSSQIFDWLEKNTETNIYYTKFDFLSANNQIILSGVSKTADDFLKQMVVFQNNPVVERISISNFNLVKSGSWEFDISLFTTDNSWSGATTKQ